MSVFVLNMTVFVLNMTIFVLNMTVIVLREAIEEEKNGLVMEFFRKPY